MQENTGKLFLCATPIGNLEDITFRVLRILKEVDLIAAEDTRQTKKLLNYYDIDTPLTSYHRFNKEGKGKLLIEKMLNGESLALVSDAGMPGISDPGYELVKLAVDSNIKVVPLPGPSAVIAALAASGLDTASFFFYGFLPSKQREREKELQALAGIKATLVFYEAPHRIKETLNSVLSVMGNRRAVIARELTKKFEEILRGTLSEIIDHFEKESPRGEITLLVEGAGHEEKSTDIDLKLLASQVLERVAEGKNKKEEIKKTAQKYGIPKRELYEALLLEEGKIDRDTK